MYQSTPVRTKEQENDRIYHFDLGDILPERVLLVNISMFIISLIAKSNQHHQGIVVQRVLTDTEMRVLLPLLASPSYCPHEVLQASYHSNYDILLGAIFPTRESTLSDWNCLVEEYRLRLYAADAQGTKRRTMRGVYNALFSLRQKLEEFGFTIRARKDGYYLSSLVRG